MMDISQVFILAIKSIIRNKTRSFLTALGIIIGVCAVILLVSLGQGLQKYITGQFEQLGTNLVVVLPGRVSLDDGFGGGPPNFAGSKLTVAQTEAIAGIGGPIDDAAAAIETSASIKHKGNSKYSTIAGITSNYGKLRNILVSRGRDISESDVQLGRKVAMLGSGMAEDLFGKGDPLNNEISIGEEKYTVIAVLAEMGSGGIGFDVDNFVAIPISAAQRLTGDDNVMSIAIKARDKESIPGAITLTKNYLGRQLKEDDFSVIDQSNLLSTINQILSVLTLGLGGIAAISLVVGGVGIMNIMLVSVTERTREIGLRKAVGAKPNDILIQFLIEAVVLSVLGGVIGITIGYVGALIISNFFPAQVTLWSVALSFGVSALVGIVFGVAPAYRASRLNPIEALRYE